jgi:RNA polymerase sporulation-specific sigma factor
MFKCFKHLHSANCIFYVNTKNSFPKPLKEKEEKDFIDQYSRDGDENARNTLIERNMRLVAHIAKKYSNTELCSDDLISIGTIGLIKSINTFNPDKGIRLATYSAKCIENAIQIQRKH